MPLWPQCLKGGDSSVETGEGAADHCARLSWHLPFYRPWKTDPPELSQLSQQQLVLVAGGPGQGLTLLSRLQPLFPHWNRPLPGTAATRAWLPPLPSEQSSKTAWEEAALTGNFVLPEGVGILQVLPGATAALGPGAQGKAGTLCPADPGRKAGCTTGTASPSRSIPAPPLPPHLHSA